ncbi:hypothetical protein HBH50_219290 [Parastagonospora nodorum]|nr:hypothetical protein HBH50_219290 [Parastagonospora nodorum]KAH4080047.1 hypothetical protein HBH48_211170 [Parastagonospora nodorum]KAH4183161.1 hypothetical protein HBH42_210420 [Parastagonospora nodorum]KAH6427459.1 hypothetical protein HBI59_203610 [Parastagonospora nodorum]
MKIFSACSMLLMTVLCGLQAGVGAEAIVSNAPNLGTSVGVKPLDNRGGWVNPEDLASMPQCVVQQDHRTWLDALTHCTSHRCTRHFGVFCTHKQWLTQLSCLRTTFSPELVKQYVPYCSRSVLTKAQISRWIHQITDRTWLVDVGDTNELLELTPYSLHDGYAAIHVVSKAPKCLTHAPSASTGELFQHALASCMFTSSAQHTGNAVRPWEYSESLRSMISLDSETAGYDLLGVKITHGEYFDKTCFCQVFTIDWTREPCSDPGNIDMTMERYWMYATCGRSALPAGLWNNHLKTTGDHYIPIEEWKWPKCVADMPKEILTRRDQCTTDACDVKSDDYCTIKPSVDKASFCRDFSYESCGGSCHAFKTRIDFVLWLFHLCRNVQDWYGLPENWYHSLARPTRAEMTPWRWNVSFSDYIGIDIPSSESSADKAPLCTSNGWKIMSLALVNTATVIAVYFRQRIYAFEVASHLLRQIVPSGWFLTGLWIAAIQLFGNLLNAVLVQSTYGYEHVPVIQLMLLWCSMPRLAWLPIWILSRQPFEAINLSATASSIFAEIIMQALSLYPMLTTVKYGREHDFYSRGLELAEGEVAAKAMYTAALMWLLVFVVALVQLLLLTRAMMNTTTSGHRDLLKWRKIEQPQPSNIAEELATQVNERMPLLKYDSTRIRRYTQEENNAMDDTVSPEIEIMRISPESLLRSYIVTVVILLLFWAAQWVFWAGFISLSSELYCPPNLVFLTIVWSVCSVAGIMVVNTWEA